MRAINDRTRSANTQFFALIGKKLTHSLSVPIHRMFFEETGIQGAYRLIEIAEDRLEDATRAFSLLGFQGFNVTIPYKQAIMPWLKKIDDFAARVGAVNTVLRREDGLYGFNTDVSGFLAMLARMSVSVAGQECVVLGASGGAARAAIEALRSEGATKLWLVTRDPAGRPDCGPDAEWIGYEALPEVRAALLVNCTPVGMYPNTDASPLPAELLPRFGAVADMIYNPLETRLMRDARAAGLSAENGLYMLVAQAVAAQEIWQGQRYGAALTDVIFTRLSGAIERGEY